VRWEIKFSLDDKLSQEYLYQKLLKSHNPSSRYSRKCRGCFFGTQYSTMELQLNKTLAHKLHVTATLE